MAVALVLARYYVTIYTLPCVSLDADIVSLVSPLDKAYTVGRAVLGVALNLPHRLHDGGTSGGSCNDEH